MYEVLYSLYSRIMVTLTDRTIQPSPAMMVNGCEGVKPRAHAVYHAAHFLLQLSVVSSIQDCSPCHLLRGGWLMQTHQSDCSHIHSNIPTLHQLFLSAKADTEPDYDKVCFPLSSSSLDKKNFAQKCSIGLLYRDGNHKE